MNKGAEQKDKEVNEMKHDRVEEGTCMMSYEAAKGMEGKEQGTIWAVHEKMIQDMKGERPKLGFGKG